ncbi:MAG: signal peptidase I [Vicinamibacterales bacterium]
MKRVAGAGNRDGAGGSRAAAVAAPAAMRASRRSELRVARRAVILALFVRTFGFQAFKIPTGSMEPNLLVGDHLLVNKFIFAPHAAGLERMLMPMRAIERGEVLVFKFPQEPERDFIKRVIGLPGETLELRDETIYINGAPLLEPYAHYQLPAGQVGVVGDVRRHYGPVTGPGRPLLS